MLGKPFNEQLPTQFNNQSINCFWAYQVSQSGVYLWQPVFCTTYK